MRLNKANIEQELEVMLMRLGLGQHADKFAAFVLLERYVNRMCTMNPLSEGEIFVLFKESYGFSPKSILNIYEDFVATLPTDVEVSISKREDELYFETEDELVTIEI